MRDDVHKSVPRPREVRRWVRRALRDADRLHGRSRDALEDAVRHVCSREVSGRFLEGLKGRVLGAEADLFGVIAGVQSPRELGGTGSPLERQVLSDCQRAIATGVVGREALIDALAKSLVERSRADVRAAEPVLLPEGCRHGITQMTADIATLDYRGIAAERLGLAEPAERKTAGKISADEDLLARQPGRQ